MMWNCSNVSYRSSSEFYYGSSNKWKMFVSNNHKSPLIYKCNFYCDCNGSVSSSVIYNRNRIKSMGIQTNVVHFQKRIRWLPIFPIAKHVFTFDEIGLELHFQIKEKQRPGEGCSITSEVIMLLTWLPNSFCMDTHRPSLGLDPNHTGLDVGTIS